MAIFAERESTARASASGGLAIKRFLLRLEGAPPDPGQLEDPAALPVA